MAESNVFALLLVPDANRVFKLFSAAGHDIPHGKGCQVKTGGGQSHDGIFPDLADYPILG
jgi:hypothetical protein